MKEMIQDLKSYAKEKPKDLLVGVLAVVTLFAGLGIALWIEAIIQGRV